MPIPYSLKTLAFQALTSLKGGDGGCVVMPVLRGPAKGLRFELDLVGRRESAYLLGKYDAAILRRLSTLVEPGWVLWDVGTYLGYYSVFFNRLTGPAGKVVCIEPDPGNLERTRRNLHLNGFDLSCYLQAAIGAPLGEIDFLLSGDTNSHIPGVYVGDAAKKSLYRERDRDKKTARIPCFSLDQAYFEQRMPAPRLIKIDIEGAELLALRHMDRLCAEIHPLLVLELHNAECDAEAWAFAKRTGYTMERIEDGRPVGRAEDSGGTLLCIPPA